MMPKSQSQIRQRNGILHHSDKNEREEDKLKNQKGQSLVEFVLLMSIVMILSLGFLKLVNGNVAKYWRAMGQVLVEDDNQRLELR